MSTISRLWTAPLLLLLATTAASAQPPFITLDTQADPATLHQWLHSADPGSIAWAAEFARRRHDTTLLAEMPDLLEHWTMPPISGADERQAGQRRAILSVLDALIQDDVQVPIPAIDSIAAAFPAQAAILIARLPLSESRSTLEHWTYGIPGSWGSSHLARIATMMLARIQVPVHCP